MTAGIAWGSRVMLGVALAAGVATSAVATPLVEAWRAAQSHDPDFAAEQAAWRAGQTAGDQGRSLLLPQINLTAGLGRTSIDNRTEGASFSTPAMGTSNQVAFRNSIHQGLNKQWQINAQMPLIDASKWAQKRQLDQQGSMAEVHYRQARQQLILNVAQAFFAVMLADQQLRVLTQQQYAIRQILNESRERFRIGDIPVTDSLEAESRDQAMQASLLAAQTDWQIKKRAWQDLTGLSAEPLPKLNPQLDASINQLAPLQDWLALADVQSPLLRINQLDTSVAQAEIDKYRSLYAPSLNLVASVGENRLSGSGDYGTANINSRGNMIGLQLNIPLFSGGYRDAKLQETLARADQARDRQQSTRQWLMRAVEAAWLGIQSGGSRVRALQAANIASAKRLQATELGHRIGERSTLDLLNAQSAYSASQLAWQNAEVDLLMNRLQLQSLSGQLDERELQALDGYLQ